MRKLKHRRVRFATEGESLTHQSERTRADINNLVRQGIELPDPNQMVFRDFSDGADFETVQNAIVEVERNFESLPSDIRDRFRNNPAQLIDFVNNPENAVEAAEMGLIDPPGPPEAPAQEVVVKDPPEPPKEAPEPVKDSKKDSKKDS